VLALKRLLAMRAYKRSQNVEGVEDMDVLEDVGLSKQQVEEMYRYLAIANYEDRFVIPTGHRELNVPEAYEESNGCGFSFGNGCGTGNSKMNMFGAKKSNQREIMIAVEVQEGSR
jgi:nitrate reductase beta subunit